MSIREAANKPSGKASMLGIAQAIVAAGASVIASAEDLQTKALGGALMVLGGALLYLREKLKLQQGEPLSLPPGEDK